MANNRILKINNEIQRELSSLIAYKLKDPRLEGVFVTVLDVDTTNELSYSRIKISVFPEEKREQTFNIIKSSIPFLRREIAKNVKLRITPELIFSLDDGINYEQRITELLKGNKKDGEKN